MKQAFITFSNTSYMYPGRILKEAREIGKFDIIKHYTEDSIPVFFQKHKQFMEETPGYGFWMWKPMIIYDMLHKLNDGDILLYADAGCHINKNGIDRYNEYIDVLNKDEYHLVVFDTTPKYRAEQYVNRDAAMIYHPDFYEKSHQYSYASPILLKKTNKTMNLIYDWLCLCTNYDFIDKSISKWFNEIDGYQGNDCDNGLFNLCLVKHNIAYHIGPYETNIYLDDGSQNYTSCDWSKLNTYPLQNRRIVPPNKEKYEKMNSF